MAKRLESEDEETGPERTCIVTRDKGDPAGMLRFVVGPDGSVVPDVRARLPGRGAWLRAEADIVNTAIKRKAFTRAFRREVGVSPDLAAQVDDLLAGDALSALSLANKAGLMVCGAFKVEDALRGSRVAALLHATGASPDGVRKLDNVARRVESESETATPTLQIFASPQLDLALGRANVIHAALLVGGASDVALRKATRLLLYRGAAAAQRTGREPDPLTLVS